MTQKIKVLFTSRSGRQAGGGLVSKLPGVLCFSQCEHPEKLKLRPALKGWRGLGQGEYGISSHTLPGLLIQRAARYIKSAFKMREGHLGVVEVLDDLEAVLVEVGHRRVPDPRRQRVAPEEEAAGLQHPLDLRDCPTDPGH